MLDSTLKMIAGEKKKKKKRREELKRGYLSFRHKQTGLRDFRGGVGTRLA